MQQLQINFGVSLIYFIVPMHLHTHDMIASLFKTPQLPITIRLRVRAMIAYFVLLYTLLARPPFVPYFPLTPSMQGITRNLIIYGKLKGTRRIFFPVLRSIGLLQKNTICPRGLPMGAPEKA